MSVLLIENLAPLPFHVVYKDLRICETIQLLNEFISAVYLRTVLNFTTIFTTMCVDLNVDVED